MFLLGMKEFPFIYIKVPFVEVESLIVEVLTL
jgi:hypothetical protein